MSLNYDLIDYRERLDVALFKMSQKEGRSCELPYTENKNGDHLPYTSQRFYIFLYN
jgi:hypothetical protein